MQGTPFVVCIGNRRVYMGAFWILISSATWDGICIMQPRPRENSDLEIRAAISKPDLRGDAELLEIFRKSGKLKKSDAKAENPYWIFNTIEFKTAWHPIAL
jgi:hypothetical protein